MCQHSLSRAKGKPSLCYPGTATLAVSCGTPQVIRSEHGATVWLQLCRSGLQTPALSGGFVCCAVQGSWPNGNVQQVYCEGGIGRVCTEARAPLWCPVQQCSPRNRAKGCRTAWDESSVGGGADCLLLQTPLTIRRAEPLLSVLL